MMQLQGSTGIKRRLYDRVLLMLQPNKDSKSTFYKYNYENYVADKANILRGETVWSNHFVTKTS